MSDGLKILLGALGGAILALLLAGGFSGSGMGYGMMCAPARVRRTKGASLARKVAFRRSI